MPKNFLTAEWQNLIMANYTLDPKILAPLLPFGTELDLWEGKCYVSLVGFLFKNTRVLGIPIPWHINFEEVNLRFYVKHLSAEGEWKRGVVFVKEIVPKRAISFVANTLYGEHYHTMKMAHEFKETSTSREVSYRWKYRGQWNHIKVTTAKEALSIQEGSEAEFITEHYWGYTRLNEKKTSQYEVVHPKWKMYTVEDFDLQCEVAQIYGGVFEEVFAKNPDSVFMADGSEVAVRKGKKI